MATTTIACPSRPARPALVVDRQPWMAHAACAGRTALFFGTAGERPERRARREARARAVCAGCPVLVPCREMARHGGENGFWGGESEEERAAAGYPPVAISRRSVQEAAMLGARPDRHERDVAVAVVERARAC